MRCFSLCLFIAGACCFAQDTSRELSRYVGKDLRKLNGDERIWLSQEFKARTGDDLAATNGFSSLQPWSIAEYRTQTSRWVLVEAYPGYSVPDVSFVKFHFFDQAWTRTSAHAFPTGYRFFLDSVTVEKRSELDRPMLVAKVTSAGPFITAPGPKRPAFEQGDYQRQYYALWETNLFMIRLEDNHGVLARNHYRWKAPPKGPAVPKRSKQAWIESLNSTNSIEQLTALVWLTGSHLASTEPRKTGHNQESVEDSTLFESVRDDPGTSSIIARLKEHKHPWVRGYAELGLAKPDGE